MGRPLLEVAGHRHCTACRRWRPLADFDLYRASYGGVCARSRCQACQRAYYRSPDRREYNRFWTEAKRREAGVRSGKDAKGHGSVPGGARRPPASRDSMLPAAPFGAWLRRTVSPDGVKTFARGVPCDPSGLVKHMRGTHERVSLGFVDRALASAGAHLADVYPELYDALPTATANSAMVSGDR